MSSPPIIATSPSNPLRRPLHPGFPYVQCLADSVGCARFALLLRVDLRCTLWGLLTGLGLVSVSGWDYR
jgi:hypothetical protein